MQRTTNQRSGGIFAVILSVLVAPLATAQSITLPKNVKSSFETLEGSVLQVFSAKEDDHRFVAYLVKWKDFEVIVSDPLARSDLKKGDEIRFMAQKVDLPNVSTLNFTILPLTTTKDGGKPAVSKAEQRRLERIAAGELDVAQNETERFYAMNRAAKKAIKEGKTEEASKLADELLKAAEKQPKDWNYGNAIQDGNQVLGRIALAAGNVDEAKKRLLASADSKGSPQMNSFGPNMQLALDLLKVNEKQVVLDYFDRCGSFWEMGTDQLAKWKEMVEKGEVPDFGGNLVY
ncbi:MAG: hypothetical protein NTW52_14530 [Planctomycetota bacterium]|nr:hypothetical protein [Planctomycetota bacterium]